MAYVRNPIKTMVPAAKQNVNRKESRRAHHAKLEPVRTHSRDQKKPENFESASPRGRRKSPKNEKSENPSLAGSMFP
jgi:hypothetical protein